MWILNLVDIVCRNSELQAFEVFTGSRVFANYNLRYEPIWNRFADQCIFTDFSVLSESNIFISKFSIFVVVFCGLFEENYYSTSASWEIKSLLFFENKILSPILSLCHTFVTEYCDNVWQMWQICDKRGDNVWQMWQICNKRGDNVWVKKLEIGNKL